MTRAQGELRGPRADAEEQYGGGDASALVGTSQVAQRTIARRERNKRLADQGLHEVWTWSDEWQEYQMHTADALTHEPRDLV